MRRGFVLMLAAGAMVATGGCPAAKHGGTPHSGTAGQDGGPLANQDDGSDGADCGIELSDAGPFAFLGNVGVGESQVAQVQVQDSADVDETIMSAMVTGTDATAFTVESTFPLDVPAGTSTTLDVQFTPAQAGLATATLELQTKGMGPSSVSLEGYGVEGASDGG